MIHMITITTTWLLLNTTLNIYFIEKQEQYNYANCYFVAFQGQMCGNGWKFQWRRKDTDGTG